MSTWDEIMREVESRPYEWTVTPAGRWSWYVTVNHGIIGLRDGFLVLGSRERAERKGRREAERWRRKDERARQLRTEGRL